MVQQFFKECKYLFPQIKSYGLFLVKKGIFRVFLSSEVLNCELGIMEVDIEHINKQNILR